MMIQVERLVKQYGKTLALDGLSFSVSKGEIVGLLGPNGAGKTTALHILLGVLTPTAGEVRVLGYSPLRDRKAILPRMNFASAYADLPSNLKVTEVLAIYARLYSIRDAREKIAALLDRFDLKACARQVVGRLSAGERMRLNLCKALLNDPELLLLDEPTLSLDPFHAQVVRELLREIQQSRALTVFYTSHNMWEVERFCNRVVFIHHGRKFAEGSPDEVKRRFQSQSLDELFIKIASGGELVDMGPGPRKADPL